MLCLLLLTGFDSFEEVEGSHTRPNDKSCFRGLFPELKVEEEEDVEGDDAGDEDDVPKEFLWVQEMGLLSVNSAVGGESGDVNEIT